MSQSSLKEGRRSRTGSVGSVSSGQHLTVGRQSRSNSVSTVGDVSTATGAPSSAPTWSPADTAITPEVTTPPPSNLPVPAIGRPRAQTSMPSKSHDTASVGSHQPPGHPASFSGVSMHNQGVSSQQNSTGTLVKYTNPDELLPVIYHDHGVDRTLGALLVASYDGKTVDGLYDGVATAKFHNGCIYEGSFAFGKMHGTGRMTWPDGNKYEGQWNRGRPEGVGSLTFPNNGGEYKGEVAKGQRHGRGVFTRGTCKYEGEYRDGNRHGVGSEVSKNVLYEGFWVHDKKEGWGIADFTSGDSYEGEWRGGKVHGRGSMRWASNDRYTGEWENGKMHGVGTFEWVEVRSTVDVSDAPYDGVNLYKGQFTNGMRDGSGIMYFSDGTVYEGEWRANTKHGKGLIHLNDGRIDEVEMKDDLLVAKVAASVTSIEQSAVLTGTKDATSNGSSNVPQIDDVTESSISRFLVLTDIVSSPTELSSVLNTVRRHLVPLKLLHSFYARTYVPVPLQYTRPDNGEGDDDYNFLRGWGDQSAKYAEILNSVAHDIGPTVTPMQRAVMSVSALTKSVSRRAQHCAAEASREATRNQTLVASHERHKRAGNLSIAAGGTDATTRGLGGRRFSGGNSGTSSSSTTARRGSVNMAGRLTIGGADFSRPLATPMGSEMSRQTEVSDVTPGARHRRPSVDSTNHEVHASVVAPEEEVDWQGTMRRPISAIPQPPAQTVSNQATSVALRLHQLWSMLRDCGILGAHFTLVDANNVMAPALNRQKFSSGDDVIKKVTASRVTTPALDQHRAAEQRRKQYEEAKRLHAEAIANGSISSGTSTPARRSSDVQQPERPSSVLGGPEFEAVRHDMFAPTQDVLFHTFVECLLRIAHHKIQDTFPYFAPNNALRMTLQERIQFFIESFVIPQVNVLQCLSEAQLLNKFGVHHRPLSVIAMGGNSTMEDVKRLAHRQMRDSKVKRLAGSSRSRSATQAETTPLLGIGNATFNGSMSANLGSSMLLSPGSPKKNMSSRLSDISDDGPFGAEDGDLGATMTYGSADSSGLNRSMSIFTVAPNIPQISVTVGETINARAIAHRRKLTAQIKTTPIHSATHGTHLLITQTITESENLASVVSAEQVRKNLQRMDADWHRAIRFFNIPPRIHLRYIDVAEIFEEHLPALSVLFGPTPAAKPASMLHTLAQQLFEAVEERRQKAPRTRETGVSSPTDLLRYVLLHVFDTEVGDHVVPSVEEASPPSPIHGTAPAPIPRQLIAASPDLERALHLEELQDNRRRTIANTLVSAEKNSQRPTALWWTLFDALYMNFQQFMEAVLVFSLVLGEHETVAARAAYLLDIIETSIVGSEHEHRNHQALRRSGSLVVHPYAEALEREASHGADGAPDSWRTGPVVDRGATKPPPPPGLVDELMSERVAELLAANVNASAEEAAFRKVIRQPPAMNVVPGEHVKFKPMPVKEVPAKGRRKSVKR